MKYPDVVLTLLTAETCPLQVFMLDVQVTPVYLPNRWEEEAKCHPCSAVKSTFLCGTKSLHWCSAELFSTTQKPECVQSVWEISRMGRMQGVVEREREREEEREEERCRWEKRLSRVNLITLVTVCPGPTQQPHTLHLKHTNNTNQREEPDNTSVLPPSCTTASGFRVSSHSGTKTKASDAEGESWGALKFLLILNHSDEHFFNTDTHVWACVCVC